MVAKNAYDPPIPSSHRSKGSARQNNAASASQLSLGSHSPVDGDQRNFSAMASHDESLLHHEHPAFTGITSYSGLPAASTVQTLTGNHLQHAAGNQPRSVLDVSESQEELQREAKYTPEYYDYPEQLQTLNVLEPSSKLSSLEDPKQAQITLYQNGIHAQTPLNDLSSWANEGPQRQSLHIQGPVFVERRLEIAESSSAGVSYDPYAPVLSKVTPILPPRETSSASEQVQTSTGDVSSFEQPLNAPNGQRPSFTTSTQYAPSPSLLGTNDPLQRISARTPVLSFGFGGRVISCFHLSGTNNGGFDVAMSSQEAKNIRLRPLHDIIPPSTAESFGLSPSFPGPLFADPGSISTGIISTGVASNIKLKKVAVLKYLSELLEEMRKGVGYMSLGSRERKKAEDKIKLVQLLRILIDHDGSFTRTCVCFYLVFYEPIMITLVRMPKMMFEWFFVRSREAVRVSVPSQILMSLHCPLYTHGYLL